MEGIEKGSNVFGLSNWVCRSGIFSNREESKGMSENSQFSLGH